MGGRKRSCSCVISQRSRIAAAIISRRDLLKQTFWVKKRKKKLGALGGNAACDEKKTSV